MSENQAPNKIWPIYCALLNRIGGLVVGTKLSRKHSCSLLQKFLLLLLCVCVCAMGHITVRTLNQYDDDNRMGAFTLTLTSTVIVVYKYSCQRRLLRSVVVIALCLELN